MAAPRRHQTKKPQETTQARSREQPKPQGAVELPELGVIDLLNRAATQPGQMTPSNVQTLQRAYGNRVVTRLLPRSRASLPIQAKLLVNHPGDQYEREADQVAGQVMGQTRAPTETTAIPSAAPPGVIQRAPLSAADMISALSSIEFVRKKLDKEIHKEKMLKHVEKVLGSYEQHFSRGKEDKVNNAMMLTMALDGVARVIAEELGDPFIQSKLASKLFALYRSDIQSKLKGKGVKKGLRQTLNLTKTLVSDDPVTKYMHDEIRIERAAGQIRAMARKARMKVGEMFNLLSQRFQAQISSHTLEEIQGFQHQGFSPGTGKQLIGGKGKPTGSFPTRETPGELSERYYRFLFGGNTPAPTWSERGLKFTEGAKKKLADLGKLAKKKPERTGRIRPREYLTEKQERHLLDIEQKERGIKRSDIEKDLQKEFAGMFSLPENDAKALVGDVKRWLNRAPLTITVRGVDWFGTKVPKTKKEKTFSPATRNIQKTKVSKIFGKGRGKIEHLGKWVDKEGMTPRGELYLRFRQWKDQLMTGLLDFDPSEMPTFGALNVNWEKTKGSDDPNKFGTNYYGDTHFVLKRSNVKDRLVYTATDHGVPRRDPLLALHDFAMGGSHTKVKDVKKQDMLIQVVNAAKSGGPVFGEGTSLLYEMQIFGEVDISRDVKEIYIAPSVSETVKENAKKFARDKVKIIKVPRDKQGSVYGAFQKIPKLVLGEDRSTFYKQTKEAKDVKLKDVTGKNRKKTLKENWKQAEEKYQKAIKAYEDAEEKGDLKEWDKTAKKELDEWHTEMSEYVRKETKGCFITTACVRSRGLADDCDELMTLRQFRDGYMRSLPRGQELISLYYAIAPQVVDAIDRREDSGAVYDKLYSIIQACVEHIKSGRNQRALAIYAEMVKKLTRQYCPQLYPHAL